MKQLTAVLVIAAAFVLTTSSGRAGRNEVESVKVAGDRAWGGVGATRNDEHPEYEIGCRIVVPEPGDEPYGECFATGPDQFRDGYYRSIFCKTYSEELMDTIRSVGPHSFIRFERRGHDTCTQLTIENSSARVLGEP